MYIVTVDLAVDESDVEELLKIVLENATSSRMESGCEQFDVAISTDSPAQIFLYEVYASEAAFNSHMKTAHLREFEESSRDLVREKRVRFFQGITA